MSFSFRKIYADVVTDDGTVLIAYLGQAEAWGFRTAYGAVEIYSPDGGRNVLRAQAPVSVVRPAAEAMGTVEVRLDFPNGYFALQYEPLHAAWTPPAQTLMDGLEWSVRVPRAAVTGRWSASMRRPDVTGSGYVDWVELSRVTRFLGIRGLEWGRVHLPNETFVFTALRNRSGTWWRRVAHWPTLSSPAPEALEDFRLTTHGDAQLLEFPETARDGRGPVALHTLRTLHTGSAFDAARSTNAVERMAFRLATGRTREQRWLSRAWPTAQPASTGVAVHELVRFGR